MIDRRPCSDWSSLIDIGVFNRARRSRAQCSQRAANRRRVIVTASRRFRGVPLRMIGGMRHLARDQASCHIPDVIQDVAAKGENRQYPHKGLRDSILEEFHHRLKTSTERFGDVNGRLRFRGASPGRSSCFLPCLRPGRTTASCGRGASALPVVASRSRGLCVSDFYAQKLAFCPSARFFTAFGGPISGFAGLSSC